MQILSLKLTQTTRRLRAVRFAEFLVQHVAVGCVAGAALVAVDKCGLPVMSEWTDAGVWRDGGLALPGLALPAFHQAALLTLAILAVLAAALRVWLELPTAERAALLLDQRLNLKERLTSARECAASGLSMAGPLQEDAERFASGLNVRRVIPFRIGRGGRWLAGAAAVLTAAVLLLPDLDLAGTRTELRAALERREKDREEVGAIRRAVQDRAKTLQEELEKGKVANPQMEEFSKKLGELAKKLDNPSLSPKQALDMLNKLEDQIKNENRERFGSEQMNNLNPPRDRRSLAKKLAENLRNRDLDGASKEMAALRDALGGGKLNPDDIDHLSKDLKDLADQFKGMGTEELSKEFEKLSQELKDLSGSEQSEEMKKLQAMLAKALKGEQLDLSQLTAEEKELLKQLQQAMAQMQLTEDMLKQMQQNVADGKARQITMQELKDMLQQMKNGQGNGQQGNCQGGGVCPTCGGTGFIEEEVTDENGNTTKRKVPCPDCHGSGKCSGGGQGGGLMGIPSGAQAGSGSGGLGAGTGRGQGAGKRPENQNPTQEQDTMVRARQISQGVFVRDSFVRGIPPGDNHAKVQYDEAVRQAEEGVDSVRERESIPLDERELVKTYNNMIKGTAE